jgi:hypothetical protein
MRVPSDTVSWHRNRESSRIARLAVALVEKVTRHRQGGSAHRRPAAWTDR